MTIKELQELPKPAYAPASALADLFNPLFPDCTMRRDGMVKLMDTKSGGLTFNYGVKE